MSQGDMSRGCDIPGSVECRPRHHRHSGQRAGTAAKAAVRARKDGCRPAERAAGAGAGPTLRALSSRWCTVRRMLTRHQSLHSRSRHRWKHSRPECRTAAAAARQPPPLGSVGCRVGPPIYRGRASVPPPPPVRLELRPRPPERLLLGGAPSDSVRHELAELSGRTAESD